MTPTAAPIAERLAARGALLLDGSMGQELMRRGVADDPVLWTAHAMLDNAEQVRDLHEAYARAGADIITTNTYATNLHRFAGRGGYARFERLNRLAGELAAAAADSRSEKPLIAASLPPLRESYRPEQVIGWSQMLDEYAPQAAILADYADLFLCETLSTGLEGRAAASAALAVADGRPVWVSWTLRDDASGRLRSGETLAEAVSMLEGLEVSGHLVNCSSPESLTAALPLLMLSEVAVRGVYANGFCGSCDDPASYAAGQPARVDLGPGEYADFGRRWLAGGANLIGGCCDVGPAHIARLRELIAANARRYAG